MLELAVFMPLAQLNGSSGIPASGPAGTAVAPVRAPAAPAPEAAVTGASATGAASATGPGTTTAASGSATEPTTLPAASAPSYLPIVVMVVLLGGLYFFMMRPQRKEEKRRKGMISELKKGDRVMTIGGMLAKVVSVEGDEVVLKIDEAANVKATYRKTSIQEVIDRDDKK